MTIERVIFIEAPVDLVWRAITDPDQIAQWMCDDADVRLEPGYAGTLVFNPDPQDRPTIAAITVQAFEPNRSFSYRWAYEPGVLPAADNSLLVEFRLTAVPGGTQLQVIESGVEHRDWPTDRKRSYVADHRRGWARHLDDLVVHVAQQPALRQ